MANTMYTLVGEVTPEGRAYVDGYKFGLDSGYHLGQERMIRRVIRECERTGLDTLAATLRGWKTETSEESTAAAINPPPPAPAGKK